VKCDHQGLYVHDADDLVLLGKLRYPQLSKYGEVSQQSAYWMMQYAAALYLDEHQVVRKMSAHQHLSSANTAQFTRIHLIRSYLGVKFKLLSTH